MSKSTPELRELWKNYECAASRMERIVFGPDRILVAPPTADAWRALAAVFAAHRYVIRTADTDSYNCRTITGGTEKSLHSYGIALDINWTTNPYRDHEGERDVRFSAKQTQNERAQDVKRALADTDMTTAMINDALAIRTKSGRRVFEWGGHWRSVKDAMHFEIDVSPEELASGLDDSTFPVAAALATEASFADSCRVIARSGLNLREGPGGTWPIRETLPAGTIVWVLRVSDGWALVDRQGDGLADGHMLMAFLERLS